MKTLKLRIYDRHIDQLVSLTSKVNFVWNYVNDLSYQYLKQTGKFLSAYDLHEYTQGSGELLGLHSQKYAKSVYDASWFEIKRQLEYKCKHAGCRLEIVNEKYTTQTCSCCGQIDSNSPKGRAGLAIREWFCTGCGTWHDRDVNAAKNILAVGLDRLGAGIPSL